LFRLWPLPYNFKLVQIDQALSPVLAKSLARDNTKVDQLIYMPDGLPHAHMIFVG